MARPPRSRRSARARRGRRAGTRPASSRRARPTVSTTGAGQPAARDQLDLPVEEGEVEAGVVRDDDGVLAREGEEGPDRRAGRGAPRRSRSSRPVIPAITGGTGTPGSTRVWNVPAGSSPSTRTAPISQMAGLPRRRPGRLQVDDDEARRLERQIVPRRRREPDARPAPGEPRVAGDDVLEQAPRQPFGRVREREEHAGGLLDGNRPAPLLDELHEPVGRIEGELHPEHDTRTCVRSPGSDDAPRGRSRGPRLESAEGRGLSGAPA